MKYKQLLNKKKLNEFAKIFAREKKLNEFAKFFAQKKIKRISKIFRIFFSGWGCLKMAKYYSTMCTKIHCLGGGV